MKRALSVWLGLGLAGMALALPSREAQSLLRDGQYARAYAMAQQQGDPLTASQAAAAEVEYRGGAASWATQAVQAARRAVAEAPADAQAHLALGQALGLQARQGMSLQGLALAREARSAMERALQLDPLRPETRLTLGRWHAVAWARAGALSGADRKLAVRLMSEGLGMDPLDVRLNVQAGLAYAALRDPQAKDFLRRALSLNAANVLERDAQQQARQALDKMK